MLHVTAIVGARPNFMKVAPLAWAAAKRTDIEIEIVHTGQHYDRNMSQLFFDELSIPEPSVNLGVGPGSHAGQTAEIMVRFEEHVLGNRPDVVLVVGDVNSTIACSLVSVKLGIPTVHVEAGLRSGDRAMPEEINRVLTDAISDVLYVTEESGRTNLINEGVDESSIEFVGNVMIDTLLKNRQKADASDILERTGLSEGSYGVVTIHRPSNVDDAGILRGIWGALLEIAESAPLILPVHPRTRGRLSDLGLRPSEGLRLIDPVGYLDFLKLQSSALMILTDSGGIQEEAVILGVPCLTMRENTERPVTIEVGGNRLVGTDPTEIIRCATAIIRGDVTPPSIPTYWDGCAAERVVESLVARFGKA